MKTFDADTLERFDRGEVDYLDAVTAIFDSGVVNLFVGKGQFTWDDDVLGEQTFFGSASLMTIEVPPPELGSVAQPIRVRMAETYVPVGSTIPVNVFDDGVRASIDEEDWQWREVIVSVFWRAKDGTILCREQLARRVIDDMPVEYDEAGNPFRVVVLERPEIVQKDIEAKTDNAELQRLIDPDDRGLEHVGTSATQRITLGAMPDQAVS